MKFLKKLLTRFRRWNNREQTLSSMVAYQASLRCKPTLCVDTVKNLRKRKTCHYCKRLVPLKFRVIDHRIPISKGGTNSRKNLVMACRSCNAKKHTMTEKEFLRHVNSI